MKNHDGGQFLEINRVSSNSWKPCSTDSWKKEKKKDSFLFETCSDF